MVNNRYILKFFIIVLFVVSTVLGPARGVFAQINDEVTIDAQGSVDYDTVTNTTTANQQVKLTNGVITIEADYLSYEANTGWVNASGKVKVTRDDGVYLTETLRYNLKDQTGSAEAFSGTIYGKDRNVKISGSTMDSAQGAYQLTDGALTRCPLDNPHYRLTAKKITFKDTKIILERAVLRLRGIPVFYFKQLTLATNQENKYPRVEAGYTPSDGTSFKFTSSYNGTSEWYINGKTKNGGYLEAGLSTNNETGNGALRNTVWGGQELYGPLSAGDTFLYDGKLFQFSIDGYYTFGSSSKNEEGLNITRKYWKTSIGDWQFGLQTRRMIERNGDQKIGGIWGGYRLDYRPVSNLTLSYLHRDDLNGLTKNDYGEFDPNLGSSVMADWGIPLSKNYRFNISGVYNLTEQKLRENYFRIQWDTCCYNLTVGWNSVNNTMEVTGNINF